MRTKTFDGKIGRKILIAMITDKEVLSRIAPKWENKYGLFESPWENVIGGWCVSHFQKYGHAPKEQIESRFDRWSQSADKDTINLVSRFLSSLSEESDRKESNVASANYIVDVAAEYFNQVRIKRLKSKLEEDLEHGKIGDALSKVHAFTRIEMGQGGEIDVFNDKEAIRRSFEAKREPIIKYSGALGQFFGSALCRDSFIGIVAADKTGKSFTCQDFAFRSALQRNKTAFFVIGDMSEEQVMERFMTRVSKRPIRKTPKNKPVKYPTQIVHQDGERFATVVHDERSYDSDLDWREAWKACQELVNSTIKSKEPKLKLSCHPGGSVSILDVKAILQSWERNGFIADCVVIDYADNLAPIDGRIETRHQINATWQEMRGIAMTMHNLVMTATQSSAKAYDSYVLTPRHFSENKMKNAHVTGMLGVNQTDEERVMDVVRFNWVRLRGEEYSVNKCVHLASCRPIGNIAIRSCW